MIGRLFELARFGQWVVQSIAVDSANLYFTTSTSTGLALIAFTIASA